MGLPRPYNPHLRQCLLRQKNGVSPYTHLPRLLRFNNLHRLQSRLSLMSSLRTGRLNDRYRRVLDISYLLFPLSPRKGKKVVTHGGTNAIRNHSLVWESAHFNNTRHQDLHNRHIVRLRLST